jgi:hypothetical protein
VKPIRDELPNRASPREHLDEVRVIVRLTGSPIQDPEATTAGLFCTWGGPLAVSLEEASRHASAVAWDEDREIFEPFVSNQRYTQFEWGASGYALEFAIELLNSVAAETVMLGMGYAIAKIRGRRIEHPDDLLSTAEDLTAAVLSATAAVFDVDRGDLEVVDLKVDRRSATVRLRSDGRTFRASVKRLNTGDPVVLVSRDD